MECVVIQLILSSNFTYNIFYEDFIIATYNLYSHFDHFFLLLDRAVILAKKGATDCSGSFDVEGIANWTECRSSRRNAQEFGKYGYHDWKYEIKPTADRPKGCYAQNRNMYWNGHRTGGKSSGSSPVCKRGNFWYHN